MQKLNPSNVLTAQLDLFPEEHVLPGVRTKTAATASEALTDAKNEGVEVNIPKDYSSATGAEFCASALSISFRIPPYEFTNINGYNYLRIRVKPTEAQNIMFFRAKKVTIIPLVDPKRQMIVVPKSQIDEEAKKGKLGLSQIVRSLVKGIKASNIEKLEEVLLPSFKLKDENQEVPRGMSHIKINERDDGLQMKGGLQSTDITLVSGSRPLMGSLTSELNNQQQDPASRDSIAIRDQTIIIKDDFVFAVNDQDLEINRIEPSLMLAAQVTKSDWHKAQ